MFFQIINYMFAGFCIGVDAFLSALPIYTLFNGLKEQFIAHIFGVDTIVVSVFLLIPFIIKIIRKFIY